MGQLAVVRRLIPSGLLQVDQRIVHPSQVPFQVEAQSEVSRSQSGDPRPRSGLFGDHDHPGPELLHGLVQALQQRHRLQVGDVAVLVGDPLAVLLSKVAVDHGGNGVAAEAIDVIALRPEEDRALQEAAHLIAPEVEDLGPPLPLFTFPGVLVLKGGCTIKVAETALVSTEVSGDEVHDDPNLRLVQFVDEVLQVVRSSKQGVATVVPTHLIAPRTLKGVMC
mmetsp:Transcript_24789/g.54032  ORF Transcript_24789/g.54032 Transcript_24789/m.54032 type:complete len:222 (-) Transcript_24789:998-1663(-)